MRKLWKDDRAIFGDIAILILMLAMLAATIVITTAMMAVVRDQVVPILSGEKDVEMIASPLVKQTYNWTAGIIMGALSLIIVMIGASYLAGVFSPEAAAKTKGTIIKLLVAIGLAPVIYIPLNMIVKLNVVVTQGFLSMALDALGVEKTTSFFGLFPKVLTIQDRFWIIWDRYYGVGGWSAYNIVPFFGLAILSVATILFAVVIFRLIFLMISYAIAPLAIVLCVIPQTAETGKKLIKIFFEATFGLLFLDIGIMFTFAAFQILAPAIADGTNWNPALTFMFAMVGLAFPVAFYKIMFNPIGAAVSKGFTAAAGSMSGTVMQGVRAGGRIKSEMGEKGTSGGGEGAGTTGKPTGPGGAMQPSGGGTGTSGGAASPSAPLTFGRASGDRFEVRTAKPKAPAQTSEKVNAKMEKAGFGSPTKSK